jgi:transcriptional regulator with XRE-family HTH domain
VSSVSDSPAAVDVPESSVDRIVNAIGPRLRDLRLQHGLSLQQLAERAGVSAAAIHKIERNGMVPTITTLLKLADAFEKPVAYFVDEQANRSGPVAVTRARAGAAVSSISATGPDFSLAGTVMAVKPGGSGGPLAPSRREALLLVLEGALRFEVDGCTYDLGTGDALHLRTDRPHHWENLGRSTARAAWVTLRPSDV